MLAEENRQQLVDPVDRVGRVDLLDDLDDHETDVDR
jgi:hypothetical protein